MLVPPVERDGGDGTLLPGSLVQVHLAGDSHTGSSCHAK
jgi:hypothetical protein